MNRRVNFFLFIVGFVLLGSGLCASFFLGLKEDRQETRNRMTTVDDVYSTFGNQIDTFNDIRNDLYSTIFDNVYYDSLELQDVEFKKTFFQYEGVVDELSKVASQLKGYCTGVYFPEKETNVKCNDFPIVYEQIVNAFVSDIALYNQNIKEYNAYQVELKANKKLELFQTDKKYIDYNQDGKFDGKEEES